MRALSKKHGSLAFVPSDSKELAHFIFLAIAAGIGEEIIFRGFLINYLISWVGNDFWGITIASLSSSALFAFLHGYQGWKSMVKIFVFSVLFSAIYIFSQSLLIVMIVHILVDIMSGIISVYILKEIKEDS